MVMSIVTGRVAVRVTVKIAARVTVRVTGIVRARFRYIDVDENTTHAKELRGGSFRRTGGMNQHIRGSASRLRRQGQESV